MRLRVSEALGAVVMTAVAIAAAAIALASLWGCSSVATEAAAWPESAEFSTLGTGQDRFSAHGTNLAYWEVIIDHRTGAQYLYRYKYGVTPLLVAEAEE